MACSSGVCSRKPKGPIASAKAMASQAMPGANMANPMSSSMAATGSTGSRQLPQMFNIEPSGGKKSTWDSFKEWLTGTPEGIKIFEQFSPEQQSALSQVLQMGLGGLQQNKFSFDPIAERETTRFHTQTVPGIAERFTSLGSGGSQRSSAFQGALGSAASDLGQGLAAQGSKYNLLQQGNLMNLLQTGLTPRYQNMYQPSQTGFAQSAGNTALNAAGTYLPLWALGVL